MGVLVGMAACVSATMVNAAATAVAWISCGLVVGSAGVPPQALIARARAIKIEILSVLFI
jgi:hypothetical protein